MARNHSWRYLWIGFAQSPDYRLQHRILPIVIGGLVLALELDANRKVVAAMVATETGLTCMPRPSREGHKLRNASITANEHMRGDFHPANLLEVWMGIPIECVCKQGLDLRATKLAWRQADAMQHDHRGLCITRPRIAIGAGALRSRTQKPGSIVHVEEA